MLVADDHAAIRAGLTMILDGAPDIEVVAEADDGAAAVRKAAALRPDVVLMDVRMPGTDGLEATRQVIEAGTAQVIVLTTFDMDEYVYGAMRAGAAGFLLKSVDAGPAGRVGPPGRRRRRGHRAERDPQADDDVRVVTARGGPARAGRR